MKKKKIKEEIYLHNEKMKRIIELEKVREMIKSERERERELNKKEKGEDYNQNFEGIKIKALTDKDLEIYDKLKNGVLEKDEYWEYKKEIDKLKGNDSRKYFLSYIGNQYYIFLKEKEKNKK